MASQKYSFPQSAQIITQSTTNIAPKLQSYGSSVPISNYQQHSKFEKVRNDSPNKSPVSSQGASPKKKIKQSLLNVSEGVTTNQTALTQGFQIVQMSSLNAQQIPQLSKRASACMPEQQYSSNELNSSSRNLHHKSTRVRSAVRAKSWKGKKLAPHRFMPKFRINQAMSVASSYKKKETLDKKCFPCNGDQGSLVSNSLEDSMTKIVQKRSKPTFSQHDKIMPQDSSSEQLRVKDERKRLKEEIKYSQFNTDNKRTQKNSDSNVASHNNQISKKLDFGRVNQQSPTCMTGRNHSKVNIFGKSKITQQQQDTFKPSNLRHIKKVSNQLNGQSPMQTSTLSMSQCSNKSQQINPNQFGTPNTHKVHQKLTGCGSQIQSFNTLSSSSMAHKTHQNFKQQTQNKNSSKDKMKSKTTTKKQKTNLSPTKHLPSPGFTTSSKLQNNLSSVSNSKQPNDIQRPTSQTSNYNSNLEYSFRNNQQIQAQQSNSSDKQKSLQIEIPDEANLKQLSNEVQLKSARIKSKNNSVHSNLSQTQQIQNGFSAFTTPRNHNHSKGNGANQDKLSQKSTPVSIQQQFQMMAEMPLQPAHKIIIPNHEPTKCSVKKNGVVLAYAANTNQGIIRNYNEDRVSIILNILKPQNRSHEEWPKCSFFGIYDGHGGSGCADFLRDSLHQFVIKEPSFPWNPKEAIRNGFAKAEKKFMEMNYDQETEEIVDKSGSCAIVVLIIGDTCFCANVGDSRCLMSGQGGAKIYPLSRDHKPSDEIEKKRIVDAGGQIYQTATTLPGNANDPNAQKEIIIGPLRVLPGRLSVSRTFGDIEAKIVKFDGNPNVIIANPDIKSFRIQEDHDFIVLGCDGIFDKLSNKETIECVWNSVRDVKSLNIHQQAGLGVEYILKNSLLRRTLDNVTVVLVAFENFQKHLVNNKNPEQLNSSRQQSEFARKRHPQMNNTDTTGTLIQETRKALGIQNFNRSGFQTPTGGQVPMLDRSLRSNNISHIEEGKVSQRKESYISNSNQKEKYDHELSLKLKESLNQIKQGQLVSPHQIGGKYMSISTKNEEIRAKVKHFDFSPQIIPDSQQQKQ